MKHFHYIADILTNPESANQLENLASPRIFQLLMKNNRYPIIERDEKQNLFVLLLPHCEYVSENNFEIRLIECNILICDRDVYCMTNDHEPFIDEIIQRIYKQRLTYDSTIYSILRELCIHILDSMEMIEASINYYAEIIHKDNEYDEIIIQNIMKLQGQTGLFKSTISPLSEVILQLFEMTHHPDDETEFIRTNQISYMIKHITSESTFLYENISILASTTDSIQNIRANNIMKTLTIMSSIFIPLSFVTGVFGMNFDITHLLTEQNFYTLMILLGIIGCVMYIVFRHKRRF